LNECEFYLKHIFSKRTVLSILKAFVDYPTVFKKATFPVTDVLNYCKLVLIHNSCSAVLYDHYQLNGGKLMKYGVAIFPSKEIQDEVNAYRKRYDPKYSQIPPHITIKAAFS